MSTHQRVFVVDDESAIANTLAIILQQCGFEARPFTSPLDALREADMLHPDLLISDVMMPELSGIDLAIRVRRLHPKCKVLLFSVRPRLLTFYLLLESTVMNFSCSPSPFTLPKS